MKLITKITLLASVSTLAFSEVSICFKKNHQDFSTLESVKLDGGKCMGNKSQNDMLQNGWKLDSFDSKNGDYLYIFKKDENIVNSTSVVSVQSVESIVDKKIQKLEKKKTEDIAKKEIIKKEESISIGKNIYNTKCSSCHGINANKKIGNSALLNTMNLDDFLYSLKGYKLGSYNLGDSNEMKPYAVGFSSNEMKDVFKYIKSINK